MNLAVSRDLVSDLPHALGYEWLETNGLGGFASGTAVGINTRRYHALLVAATDPPVGRMVMLSRVEDAVTLAGRRLDMASAMYPGTIHPPGHLHLREFRLDPFPTFVYGDDRLTIKRTVCMLDGRNTTVVLYELVEADEPAELEVRPFVAGRDYHGLVAANETIDRSVRDLGDGIVEVAPYAGIPALRLGLTIAGPRPQSARFDVSPAWYYHHEYPEERNRGMEYREDLFTYGSFRLPLQPGKAAALVASTETEPLASPLDAIRRERQRRRDIARSAGTLPAAHRTVRTLVAAADQFLVRRGTGGRTVIAGYPWFTDWTRDTLIALPGLTLATGRFEDARSLLATLVRHQRDGLLPTRFADGGGEPDYGSADASLWLFVAVRRYLDYCGDQKFVLSTVRPVCQAILDAYERGTSFGIRMDTDGLITAAAPGVPLTWMDGRIGDTVVTPRAGKPVEVQALWYNAVRIGAELARRARDPREHERLSRRADAIRDSFVRTFWNEQGGCLYDLVDEAGRPDAAIRPNQLFALSLPHALLAGPQAESILAVVERELLTPFGLRTLSPRDPAYVGRYAGPWRDLAYHQGSVWPWLLGPLISATVALRGRRTEVVRRVRSWLGPLEQHLGEAGMGQISEIFEGDPPHAPCGCIAQAWSVAEVLRAYREDVMGIGPGTRSRGA